jgi:hypothetical protein
VLGSVIADVTVPVRQGALGSQPPGVDISTVCPGHDGVPRRRCAETTLCPDEAGVMEVSCVLSRGAGHGGGDTVCCRVSMRVQHSIRRIQRCADTTVWPDKVGALLAQAVSEVSCVFPSCVVTCVAGAGDDSVL